MNIQWPVFLVDRDGYMSIYRDQPWFEGQVEQIGNTDSVISNYLRAASEALVINLEERKDRSGNGAIQFTSVILKDDSGNNLSAFQCGKNVVLSIKFKRLNNTPIINLILASLFMKNEV